MIINKKLKLWTIITHALIIIGMGHGVACFLLLELFWLATFFSAIFHWNFTAELLSSTLSVACLLSLLGEVAITFYLFKKSIKYSFTYPDLFSIG